MAEIVIRYDTQTKGCSVEMDGQAVADLDGIYIGRRYSYEEDGEEAEGKFHCELMTARKDKDQKTRTMTRVVACEQGLVPATTPVPARLQRDIEDYLDRGRRE